MTTSPDSDFHLNRPGALIAALPDEEAPPGRLKIEQLRREAMKAAEAGLVIKLDDLT